MAKTHDQELNDKGANAPSLRSGLDGNSPYSQEHRERGLRPAFFPILGF
jgi:hypothetical protein